MAELTLFLAGDVMTGRGVDQILPSPGDPRLAEELVKDAREYVALAEAVSGPIPRPVEATWPWGDALAILDEARPDVRILNVETSVTRSDDFAPGKRVHYRMHPDNVDCLAVVRPAVCVLANNHVLDFGQTGLTETLGTLDAAGLAHTGAGRNAEEAQRRRWPWSEPGGWSCTRSGRVQRRTAGWAATADRGGVAYLADLSTSGADALLSRVRQTARHDDVVVVSSRRLDWGYKVTDALRRSSRIVSSSGSVDVVYGHSCAPSASRSRSITVAPILYGCGDLVNDYEGIRGFESFRSKLAG